MSKSIKIEQSHAIVQALVNNVDWRNLDGDLLQEQVIGNPKEAGRQFTAFLKGGARMIIGDLKITTASFDPASFIGKNWKDIAEERDEKSAALKELDLAKTKSVSCLREGETTIRGEEKLRRLKENGDIRLGATVFMGLWQDYQAKGEDSVLERAYQAGIIRGYLDFFGDVFLDPRRDRRRSRCVLYLCRLGVGRWGWGVDWLGRGWSVGLVSLVSSQVGS